MTQRAFAVFMALHGVVHAVGFTVAWQIGGPRGVEYSTALLHGSIEIGDLGTRLFGLAWLATAAAFVGVAALLWRRHRHGLPLAVGLLAVSVNLCILGLPGSEIGLAIDLALLGLLAVASGSLVSRTAAA